MHIVHIWACVCICRDMLGHTLDILRYIRDLQGHIWDLEDTALALGCRRRGFAVYARGSYMRRMRTHVEHFRTHLGCLGHIWAPTPCPVRRVSHGHLDRMCSLTNMASAHTHSTHARTHTHNLFHTDVNMSKYRRGLPPCI